MAPADVVKKEPDPTWDRALQPSRVGIPIRSARG